MFETAFPYHFTKENFSRIMGIVREVSRSRGVRVLVASLVSDENNGFSCYVDGDVVVSLASHEGILEVEID